MESKTDLMPSKKQTLYKVKKDSPGIRNDHMSHLNRTYVRLKRNSHQIKNGDYLKLRTEKNGSYTKLKRACQIQNGP